MLLAIKGKINKAYHINKNEFKSIGKFLNGISHAHFKKNETLFKWIGISGIEDTFSFDECLNDLQTVGLMSKEEVSKIKDSKTNQNNKSTKNKKNTSKNNKTILSKNTTKTKNVMPGEFKLEHINMSMQDNARSYFLWYISEGGDECDFGNFKGEILKIKKDRILFKRIYVEFDENCGDVVEGKEDHVWMFDIEPFIKKGVKVGDNVEFTALGYAYKRQDGSIDFGLKCPSEIEIISNYELPSDIQLKMNALDNIICEACIFTSHCNNDICISPKYREEMIAKLMNYEKKINL